MERGGLRGLSAQVSANGHEKRFILYDANGVVSVKTIVWLIILAIVSYAGYLFLPHAFKYLMLRTDLGNEARLAHSHTDSRIVERILEKAEGWSMPLEEGDIRINRDESEIYISVDYEAELNVLGVYKTDINYTINVSAPLRR